MSEFFYKLSENQTEIAIKYARNIVLFVEGGMSVREIAFELDLLDDDLSLIMRTMKIDIKTKSQMKIEKYKQQLQVLTELGFTAEQIGDELGKSPNTIKQYCRINDIKFID